MKKPIENFWNIRLNALKGALEGNNFEAYVVDDADAAKDLVLDQILPSSGARSVSWGGSLTFTDSGLYEAIRDREGLEVLDTFDKKLDDPKKLELRRQSLLVDLFFTGTNAITETGKLVNLDMIGNRVAALTFGPKHVVLLVGRNKVVPDIEQAMLRIKNYAAPVNTMRLDKETPCIKTSFCQDCKSPERICNTWTITEKSFPKGRVKVVLINEDMGF
jgi:L-lactate utilization protein LutC